MEIVLKELTGFSGSTIYLMKSNDTLFVRKINNVERNVEQLRNLKLEQFKVPEILNYTDNILDIEYIHGLDIKNYLKNRSIDHLYNFLEETLIKLSSNSNLKDYTEVYKSHLNSINWHPLLPFTKEEIFEKLPKILPQSIYHGDLTLENILFSEKDNFYLIDPVTTNYDSWVFDIAKMRQDMQCKWFVRKDKLKIRVKLEELQEKILNRFPEANDDYLLIMMLLRVFKYAKHKTKEQRFLLEEIIKLWK